MSHLTHVHPIRTRRGQSAVATLAGGFPFAVSRPVDVHWPDPLWFPGRRLVVPDPVRFALGTTALVALPWRPGTAGRVAPGRSDAGVA